MRQAFFLEFKSAGVTFSSKPKKKTTKTRFFFVFLILS